MNGSHPAGSGIRLENGRRPRAACGFESHGFRLVLNRLGRQPADHSRSEREMLRVRLPPEPYQVGHDRMILSPCGAVRSARHPVTVEIAGSNPVGGAMTIRR